MNVDKPASINKPDAVLKQAISRRSFLKASAAITAVNLLPSLPGAGAESKKPTYAVIGAGAFGGWTALNLLRKGANVLLIDAWGPGNSRASSGGETRVIRAIYGANKIYVQWAARSLELWQENEARWKRKVFFKTGAIWMVRDDGKFERDSMPYLKELGLAYQEWTPVEAAKKYPQISFDGVKWVLHEDNAGYITARQSCQLVLDSFQMEGGIYILSSVQPGKIQGNVMENVSLSNGTTLTADGYVFACGPWLGKIFPEVIGNKIRPSRQEVFFFGTPAGDSRFYEDKMPVWVDHGEKLIYGIPGNERRGMKIADDSRGPDFDPTSGERTLTPDKLNEAREFLEHRFPDLKGAPLLESRVCQYENSPDSNYVIDRHPGAQNVWIVGGGSGHGFKMGPALGEYVADAILNHKPSNPFFSFSRLEE
jgi:glycine/D-amino acid oxidase-like deaminating enzyme